MNISVVAEGRDIKADLSGADTHVAFFTGAFESSIFPRARCPQFADRLGTHSRMDAWKWVTKESKVMVAR